MGFELDQDKHQLSGGRVATDLIPRMPVKLGGTSALLFLPIATAADVPAGVTGAATYVSSTNDGTPEVPVVYFSQNVKKLKANGSTGAGVDVFVSSTNGGVGPSGIIVASAHFVLGQTLSAAAAGELVSVFINPRKA